MLARLAKRMVRRPLALLGYEIRQIASPPPPPPPTFAVPPSPFAPPPPPPPDEPVEPVHGIDSMEGFLRFLHGLGFRPQCVLDVGANETYWSDLASKVFPDARFVLIEPLAEMVPALDRFCAEHPRARFVSAGAGPEPSTAVLTVWEGFAGSTFILKPDPEAVASGRQRVLPIVTIDSEFENEPHLPDLVKLDIQGYELEALKGATRLFGHTEVFVLEVSLIVNKVVPAVADVVAFMHERGYQVYDICGYLRRPVDDALGQVDLVFARSDGPLCADLRWRAEDGPPPALRLKAA